MVHVRLAGTVLALAAALALPAAAGARTDAGTVYRVAGTEIAFTSTEGQFVGYASGGAGLGAFDVVVDHTALPPPASITGGTFTMDVLQRGLTVRQISGMFSNGGTIASLSSGAGCTNQTFSVEGDVSLSGGGSGSFDVTLTHHRIPLFGSCVTYAGTIAGTLTLP